MKKYLPLTIVLLITVSALFYQWLQADEEANLLNARTYSLQRDLAKIDMVRDDLPAFREELSNTQLLIETLQKRLPPEPGEEALIKQVIERFKAKNVAMVFYYSTTVDKEFYKEIGLVFQYDQKELEDSVILEVFQDMDRLALWENNKQDKIVVTRIYNTLQDMDPDMPKMQSCGNFGKENLSYWPFNKVIKSKREQIEKLCFRRTSNQELYAKIKLLEQRKKSQQILTTLVQHLDPEN